MGCRHPPASLAGCGKRTDNAAALWLNEHALKFGFDSYDTNIEVFHVEYRYSQGGAVPADGAAALLECCKTPAHLLEAAATGMVNAAVGAATGRKP